MSFWKPSRATQIEPAAPPVIVPVAFGGRTAVAEPVQPEAVPLATLATQADAQAVRAADAPAHMTLEAALRQEGVAESYIQLAKARQQSTQESLAQLMRPAEYGFLAPEAVARVNASMGGLPYFPPSKVDSLKVSELLAQIATQGWSPAELSTIVPTDWDGTTLTVAVPERSATNDALRTYRGVPQRYVVASERTIQRIFRAHFSRSEHDVTVALARLIEGLNDEDKSTALVPDFLHFVLRHGCYRSASDVAFTPLAAGGGSVRVKVDGVGTILCHLTDPVWRRVLNRIVTQSGKQDQLSHGPVDGAYEIQDTSGRFDDVMNRYRFRMALIPRGVSSETEHTMAVFRIIDSSAEVTELSQLGYDKATLARIQDYLRRQVGMLLITGPTGSGKSTTLYAALSEVNPVERWIMSIENPIEYRRGLWNQAQVRPNQDEGQAAYGLLKGFLRAAPNVLLVGEMRKADIAKEAFEAANTGHLVLSTLHTNDAALAITRLRGFDLDMSGVGSVLAGILAQRLVRTLCSCAVADTSPHTITTLDRCTFLNVEGATKQPRRAVGCPNCGFSGYRGRTMVYELLDVTPTVRDAIERGDPPSAIARLGIEKSRTLMANALKLVAAGTTSLEEVQGLGDMGSLQ